MYLHQYQILIKYFNLFMYFKYFNIKALELPIYAI